jgi:predicted RNase H-like HicB family nuclease
MNKIAAPIIGRGAIFRAVVNPQTFRWITHERGTYRCAVTLLPEEEGGFSAVSANLPGVASQGETEDETMENFREALMGSLASYKAHNEPIPWKKPEIPEGVRTVWIVVHG